MRMCPYCCKILGDKEMCLCQEKGDPLPVRPEWDGSVRETPRTNKAAYEYDCAEDDPDRDAIRWCNLLNECRRLEIDLIEANEKAQNVLDEAEETMK